MGANGRTTPLAWRRRLRRWPRLHGAGCALAWCMFAAVLLAGVSGPSGPSDSARSAGPAETAGPSSAPGGGTAFSRDLAAPGPSALPAAARPDTAPAATAPKADGTAEIHALSAVPAGQLPDASPSAAAMTVSDPLQAQAFTGSPQVGAVFAYSGGTLGDHYCTGSVVASPVGDVVVTAAHCIYDPSEGSYITDIAFVPGYHDGQAPYGVWVPTHEFVDSAWMDDASPDDDFAFITVAPSGAAASSLGATIQDVVGADQLRISPAYDALTRVIGYPATTEEPVTCTNYTSEFSATQLEFDCGGFPGGTSGGPLLTAVNPLTGLGTVGGVIGGYESGGDTPDVSYAAYFGSNAAALYAQAVAAG